jgi:hypothetical protein
MNLFKSRGVKKWIYETYSVNTYHKGGGTAFDATDSKDFGKLVQILNSTLYSTSNKSITPTYVLSARATTSDSWTELGRITHGGGSFQIDVSDKKLYRYVRIYQSVSQWRRSDGNEVCSIEPWKVNYRYEEE